MLAPWPDWTAKTLASADAACWSGDTTWKLGGVWTGTIDFDNETRGWEVKSTDNLFFSLSFSVPRLFQEAVDLHRVSGGDQWSQTTICKTVFSSIMQPLLTTVPLVLPHLPVSFNPASLKLHLLSPWSVSIYTFYPGFIFQGVKNWYNWHQQWRFKVDPWGPDFGVGLLSSLKAIETTLLLVKEWW